MSEGLAEVMLLSSGYMSIERPLITWSSRLQICKAHFQIGAVFINKLQIWVLNNYIIFSCCGTSGVDTVLLTYREETKQPRRPVAGLPQLEFSPALESWSDSIFTRVLLLALSFCRRFPLFVFLSTISFSHSAWLFTEGSLLHIIDTPLTADWLRVCFGTPPDSVL